MSLVVVAWYPRFANASTPASIRRRAVSGCTSGHSSADSDIVIRRSFQIQAGHVAGLTARHHPFHCKRALSGPRTRQENDRRELPQGSRRDRDRRQPGHRPRHREDARRARREGMHHRPQGGSPRGGGERPRRPGRGRSRARHVRRPGPPGRGDRAVRRPRGGGRFGVPAEAARCAVGHRGGGRVPALGRRGLDHRADRGPRRWPDPGRCPMTSFEGAGVVVTGGGGGIGATLSRRFAAAGARVVVADLNGDAAAEVAKEIDGTAFAGDVASEEGVAALIEASRAAVGEVDVFCANAGIAPFGGAEAPEEVWAKIWDVNVMAHVRAARLLLPGWLERGKGHFIATASAAGLLTTLGSAPYSVTKHGAVAFAEWLSATYRHRGLKVQAICPQGVRTAMLDATGPAGQLLMGASAIEPDQVADALFAAIEEKR